MKDWQSISESPFYEKANAYVEETHNNDCTLEAFIDGAESRQAEIEQLKAQIEKMKNCKNCANYMISDKCPGFYKTGWCKNWEMTRSKK